MNPDNKLKTPAGYNGRTSAAGYDLNFELAERGLIKGWTLASATGPAVKITNGAEGRSVAIASDGKQHSAIYMDNADGIEVKLNKLPTDSWHAIVGIVRALPEGVPERPDNPESAAVFDIPANTAPLTDDEIAEHVATSTSLGNFQGGKWVRIADAFVKANADAPAEIKQGKIAQNALGFDITDAADGDYIEITNGANAKLLAYRITGAMSYQEAVPTPEVPQEIKHTTITTIQNTGTNLLQFPYAGIKPGQTIYSEGVGYTCQDDGGIHIKGKPAGDSNFTLMDIDLGPTKISTARGQEQATNGLYSISKYMYYSSDIQSISINIYAPSGELPYIDEVIYPQANKGSSLLPYEAPKGGVQELSKPIDLYGIGEARDTIEKRGNVWGVMRRTTSDVLGPDDVTEYGAYGAAKHLFQADGKDYHAPNTGICNMFRLFVITPEQSEIALKEGEFRTQKTPSRRYYFFYDAIGTLEAFKAKLAKTPIKIAAELDTPRFEPLPDADQEIFNSLRTFAPYTLIATQGAQHIEYITAPAQPIIDIIDSLATPGVVGWYSSTSKYSPKQCLDYATRDRDVAWSDSEVRPAKGEAWKAGNVIELVIQCNNGDNYVTKQKVVSQNALRPLGSYYIQSEVKPPKAKQKLVIFGDSWSDPAVSDSIWGVNAGKAMGLEVKNYAKNAAGFTLSSNTIAEQVSRFEADTSYSKDDVQHIVFLGGINDYKYGSQEVGPLVSAIASSVNKVRGLAKNATILYANNFEYPYTVKQSKFWQTLHDNLTSQTCIGTYNPEGTFGHELMNPANYFHLTKPGQQLLARNIVAMLQGGQAIGFQDEYILQSGSNAAHIRTSRNGSVVSVSVMIKVATSTPATQQIKIKVPSGGIDVPYGDYRWDGTTPLVGTVSNSWNNILMEAGEKQILVVAKDTIGAGSKIFFNYQIIVK